MLPHTIISTVGTSLLSNLQNLAKDSVDEHRELLQAYLAGEWGQLSRRLRQLDSNNRLCDAEINSLHDLLERRLIQTPPLNLHFCVSETDDGKRLGDLLQAYYEEQEIRTRVHIIEGLQDARPSIFRMHGLRNLARKIGEIIRQVGDPSCVAINATGGYKAQIAIAVLIGQTLGVAVYYKHERFPEIISFPPMPISFNYDLLGRHAALLGKMERGKLFEMAEEDIDPSLRVLLEEAESDEGKRLWALAPIGQIYLEGFRQRYPLAKTLPPPADKRTAPTLPAHHYPIGFKDFVAGVWRENGFITGCHSLPYDKQQSMRDREFYVRHDGQIVGEYTDRNGFGARFAVNTTAETMVQKTAVIIHLNEKYGHE